MASAIRINGIVAKELATQPPLSCPVLGHFFRKETAMRPKLPLVVAVVCWSLAALASPSLADEAKAEAAGPIATLFAPAGCGTVATSTAEPLLLKSCSVQIECADSSVISCSGSNTCATGGTNNRCVVCDGVQQSCCPVTCCEQCAANRDACWENCTRACGVCGFAYNNCVAGCTGGCP